MGITNKIKTFGETPIGGKIYSFNIYNGNYSESPICALENGKDKTVRFNLTQCDYSKINCESSETATANGGVIYVPSKDGLLEFFKKAIEVIEKS